MTKVLGSTILAAEHSDEPKVLKARPLAQRQRLPAVLANRRPLPRGWSWRISGLMAA
jgi:hypothetical protein